MEPLLAAYARPLGEGEAELEVRFGQLTYEMFEEVYDSFAAGSGAAGSGVAGSGATVELSVNLVCKGQTTARGAAPPRRIYRKVFGPQPVTDYYEKGQAHPPLKFSAPGMPPHQLVLSTEKPVGEFLPENCLVRIKHRTSWLPAGALSGWRVDATIVRQLAESEARPELKGEVQAVFGTPGVREKPLDALNLRTNEEARARFKYELELEHVGAEPPSPASLAAAIKALLQRVSPGYLEAARAFGELAYVAELLGRSGRPDLKELTTQAQSLTRVEYGEIFPPAGYFLSDKADGVHALAVLREASLCLVAPGAARPLIEFEAPGVPHPIVLDGEMVGDTFWAFDVLAFEGVQLAQLPFSDRVAHLPAAVEAMQAAAPAASVRAKPFERLEEATLAVQLTAFRDREREYESDGLMFYAPGGTYAKAQIYKWKPDTTIDFLAVLAAGDVYHLYAGASLAMVRQLGLGLVAGEAALAARLPKGRAGYQQVAFTPADAPRAYLADLPPGLDGAVVELSPGPHAEPDRVGWKFLRTRADRKTGNDFRICELNLLNFRDPLTFEMLHEGPGGYFAGAHDSGSSPARAFVSYAKSEMMGAHIAGRGFVVDLGAGRGADLGRYLAAGIGALLAVDSDRPALAELVRRRYSWAKKHPNTTMRLHVRREDFTDPHAEVVGRLRSAPGFPEEGADAVICNLAAHYAFGSREGIDNFAALVSQLLRPGGLAQILVLDGARVLALLAGLAPGEEWAARTADGSVVRYAIRRQFAGDKIASAGQRIAVRLPFSAGEYYEEFLVNLDALEAAAAAHGLKLTGATRLWEEFGAGFKRGRAQFDAGDQAWLGLMVALRFERAAG